MSAFKCDHLVGIGLAFCTPIPLVPGPEGPRLAMVSTQWHRKRMGLSTPTNFTSIAVNVDGMEVGDARNAASELTLQSRQPVEFLFFLDYDVLPDHDALTKLIYRARHYPDHDMFCGVYCSKSAIPEPLIYHDSLGWGKGPYWDWAIGDLITQGVIGVHMGCTLIRTSLLSRLSHNAPWQHDGPCPWIQGDEPWFHTTNETRRDEAGLHTVRGTEDLWFCKRAVEEVGAKILVDTSVLCGHMDHGTGKVYGLPRDSMPGQRAKWLTANGTPEYRDEKKALDIGAGGRRRTWEGFKTYTTDIRKESGADYVQDTLHLNLPVAHFDLIASSHHLEHIPRWEQAEVWRKMFHLTKPGGACEHIVPNIDWAAARIMDGEADGNVMNVLYGAQEAQGYERIWNTHFFGYTKGIAQAMAEESGYVDVTVEDWRDRPELGYEMVIRGKRPAVDETPTELETQTIATDAEPVLSGGTWNDCNPYSDLGHATASAAELVEAA